MTRGITQFAPAKINLALAVTGKRDDGYHELRSVFATIDLADSVRVAAHRRLEVRIAPDVGASPGDDLASRAVRAMATATGREPAAFVHIRKRVPVAAGLGGGSSDAGAVLRALATIWKREDVDLVALAATIGSDVPFFASGARVAYVSGRGERVDPLPDPTVTHVVIVRSRARLATKDVFAERHVDEGGAASAVDALRDAFVRHSVTPRLLRDHARNDLLGSAERLCPTIADARSRAAEHGIALSLSGSGPTLFAIADDRRDALRIARRLRRIGLAAHAHTMAG
ncbi:MAG TPA: 4-(cytidine 5'-diphospho)-2-C-methyl-D-erythritol kinase [Candidatus Limnocylindria bacterium]|jgi:4-diphosphocytidyl-2-C-methyl-D-erythritol kinase|nr:4-(cytidine 5'-diphospho)-2-C-methyl-D-erythritol kinase [Candidatus Limnocylindria bacterium]